MEIGHVGAGTFAGIIFSLCISIALPVVLLIVVHKKTKARMAMAVIGAATFFLFAMVLEQILHAVVLGVGGERITGNIWIYGLYGGLAAGLFEEVGRFVAMRFAMKKQLNLPNALMYGVGHGGIEAILIVGLASVSNLVTSIMINAGTLEASLGALDQATKEATLTQLSALWTTPSYQFFLSGIERIVAVTLHIALSVLVFQAVKLGKKRYWFLAFAIHVGVDFATVITANYLNLVLVEVMLAVLVAGVVALTISLCRKNWDVVGFEVEAEAPVVDEGVAN
ncbi:MAG: YhfC family glutamic-type intramembrane protease [Lachnospiraceae bacterium]|nr:YhfC family glutamic-type intramembrane protease [Lachnospiraceae bacterium]MDY5522398.1 YhfC family glutamic-type intramembrane protease [Agathobacter sp.]